MKQKIGTSLDSKVLVLLKKHSRQTGKPVNRLIEEAVLSQGKIPTLSDTSSSLRMSALEGFIGTGPRLSRKVVDEILAEDSLDA